MLERGLLRGAAGQRRSIRARGVNGLEIILGEQMERAEHLVVLEVERPCGFEIALEGNRAWGFDDELLGCSHLTVELLLVLSRDPRGSPRSAVVVVVRVAMTVI
jgi:hypothetical protein